MGPLQAEEPEARDRRRRTRSKTRSAEWASTRPTVEAPGLSVATSASRFWRRARAAVVPSQWQEPFGLVIAEAMSASVPSIAPAHGSFPELIQDGVDGVLFAPGDTDALARLFGEVENDPARWAVLGAQARLSYERRFVPDNNIRELEGDLPVRDRAPGMDRARRPRGTRYSGHGIVYP